MKKKYPCPKEKRTGMCEFGGNKYYGYGFFSGTASYCRAIKRWIHDFPDCPYGYDKTIPEV